MIELGTYHCNNCHITFEVTEKPVMGREHPDYKRSTCPNCKNTLPNSQ